MILPALIAANKVSLPIAALASSIALDLLVILLFALILASASFSRFSKSLVRSAKLSLSSFFRSSTAF